MYVYNVGSTCIKYYAIRRILLTQLIVISNNIIVLKTADCRASPQMINDGENDIRVSPKSQISVHVLLYRPKSYLSCQFVYIRKSIWNERSLYFLNDIKFGKIYVNQRSLNQLSNLKSTSSYKITNNGTF